MTVAPISKPRRNVFQWLFTPTSPDFRLVFRERTIRIVLPTFLVLTVLSLLSSFLVYENPGLSIFPIAIGAAGVALLIAQIAILKGDIRSASFILVFVLVFFNALIQTDPSSAPVISSTYFTAIVLSSLILPLEAILPVAGIMLVLVVAIAFLTGQGQVDTSVLSSIIIPSAAGLALLYAFRYEYDGKLLKTEQARLEADDSRKQAEEAKLTAEDANKAKSQFLANMSHELRTPLGAMISYAALLENGMISPPTEAFQLSPAQVKILSNIRSNGDHLLGMINDLLDLSKISAGRMKSTFMDVNPFDENFIKGAVDSLRSLSKSTVTLELTFDENVPRLVFCDSVQIQQILKNLVGNALKFTEKGSVKVHVSAPDEKTWRFTVADTGMGIDETSLAHIFEEFYQADNSNTRQKLGTGLGLAIVKSHVDRHFGTITVSSKLGEGTTFTVTLPRDPKAEAVAQPTANPPSANQPTANQPVVSQPAAAAPAGAQARGSNANPISSEPAKTLNTQ